MEDRFITPLQPLRSMAAVSGLGNVNGEARVADSDTIKGQEFLHLSLFLRKRLIM